MVNTANLKDELNEVDQIMTHNAQEASSIGELLASPSQRLAPKVFESPSALRAPRAFNNTAWVGIIANLCRERHGGQYVGDIGTRIRDDLTAYGFNPSRVTPLWNYKAGFSGYAVVEFNNSWAGFADAMRFENYCAANLRGKTQFTKAKSLGDQLYGWIAHEEDYNADDIVGEQLKKMGVLKTAYDVQEEEERKNSEVLTHLSNDIEVKNNKLMELEIKYRQIYTSFVVTEHKNRMICKTHNEELVRMQEIARSQLERISNEHEESRVVLEAMRKELEGRDRELKERATPNEKERNELEAEKKKNQMSILEQEKADKRVLKLAEDHRREKEILHRIIIELGKQFDAKQAVEKQMIDGGDDLELKKQMELIEEELKEKEGELEGIEDLNAKLIVKERKTNDELRQAHKELIDGLENQSSRALIDVDWMGNLDLRPFQTAMKRKYSGIEAEEKAAELCSLWDNLLRDSSWYPFKIVKMAEKEEEIIDEDDEKLKDLKQDLGEEVYSAVTTALVETNKYNPCSR